MCGFAGFINLAGLAGKEDERRKTLGDMLDRIAHRGPDDETFYDDGILALGFRRLSIVDVEGGRQPFVDKKSGVVAAVNGEIYNHLQLRSRFEQNFEFCSRSDSEVLLPLYRDDGLGMLDAVNGIFAAVIWDRRRRRLVLARDRLGVKPLYYAKAGDLLLFGSELKALLGHPYCPRTPDWLQIRNAHALHVPEVPSFLEGVHHVPAAHMLMFDGTTPALKRYWAVDEYFAEPGAPPGRPASHYIERYGELLRDSIRKQLMSDVPLGIFLSGGIDSSLIAAAARRDLDKFHCFTIEEETTAMTGDLGQARKVAAELGLPLHAVRYRGTGMLDELGFDLAYFEYMVWCVDSPRFNLEWFFKHELYRYVKTRHPEIKVILTGAGADEFAGGYSTSFNLSEGSWDSYLQSHVEPRSRAFRARENPGLAADGPQTRLGLDRASRRGYQHMMYMNLVSLQVYNLWYEDRVSAAHGIEARVPFLDHRLVEFLVSVPEQYFGELFWNKQIVRAQLGSLLPSYPAAFPKVPFIFVPGNISINSLRTAIVARVYPAFSEKYVRDDDPMTPGVQLDRMFQLARAGARESIHAERQLLSAMQTVIFRELCRNGWRNPPSIPNVTSLTGS